MILNNISSRVPVSVCTGDKLIKILTSTKKYKKRIIKAGSRLTDKPNFGRK